MANAQRALTICFLWVISHNAFGARLTALRNAGLPREVSKMLLAHEYETSWGEGTMASAVTSSAANSSGLRFRSSFGSNSAVNLDFKPDIHSCDHQAALEFFGSHPNPPEGSPAHFKQLTAMRHMRRVKRVFAEEEIPVILSNGMLLGWQRSCLSIPKDPDSDFVIFGQWIEDAGGLQKLKKVFANKKPYLSLETHMCKEGPLAAGCELRVTSHDSGAYSDIMVLFPPKFGTLPDDCDNTQCGPSCEKCAFSLPLYTGDVQGTSKYYACPTTIANRGFELIIFMGETFWAPSDIDEYLVSVYGPKYRAPGYWLIYKPCSTWYKGIDYASTPYQYGRIAGLQDRHAIMRFQRGAEASNQHAIRESADFERTLWSSNSSGSPWDREPEAFQVSSTAASSTTTTISTTTTRTTSMKRSWAQPRAASFLALPTALAVGALLL